MGLSTSQARLLSITSRISQNELRSEQITRQKTALAQETADLSKKYINALNEQDLTYAIYDQDGEKTYKELTGSALSEYMPLKNQYALVNANGQVLVSELDAENYEKSTNLNEFLAKYGIKEVQSDESDNSATDYSERFFIYNDTDKAQWYANLWFRMNGDTLEKDGYTTIPNTTTNAISGTFTNQKRWDILEDGLMNNSKWLKYALETCAVTIERVEFSDPNEMHTGIKKTKWNPIIYTNSADIGFQQNKKIAAQVEAEFDRKQRALTAKDKQYDSILKLLDTEHNALQQEYESAKSVITKNTERSLKIYS